MKIGVFVQNRDFFGAKLIHIPLLYSLTKKYPDSEIIVFTPYKDNHIFIESKLVKKVISYNSVSLFSIVKILRKEKFDILISLRPSSTYVNLALFLSGAKERIGFKNLISFLSNTTTKIYNKNIYRALAFMDVIDSETPIDSYFSLFDSIKLSDKKNIFILPGGGEGNFKKWDIEKYISLCEKIGSKDFYFVFVLGSMEKNYEDDIKKFIMNNEGTILFNKTLSDLISYFKGGDLFISNDCGPAHIAQMMKKTMLILYSDFFGDADKVIKEWFLPHNYSRFIKSKRFKSINTISVDEVYDKVKELLSLIER
ncbi:MAG: glycosyltransferase family 9 protein [Elusimicrobiota bacterium]